MICHENSTKVIVSKWVDKQEVAFLTTKSCAKIREVQTRSGMKNKPSTIKEYNFCYYVILIIISLMFSFKSILLKIICYSLKLGNA